MSKIVWFTFDTAQDRKFARVPEWWKYVATVDGTVFVPATMAGSEQAVGLCAMYDGTPCLLDGDYHAYFPAEWMAREFPDTAEACAKVIAKVGAS